MAERILPRLALATALLSGCSAGGQLYKQTVFDAAKLPSDPYLSVKNSVAKPFS